MKTLIFSLLFASSAHAGLCLDQLKSCNDQMAGYCSKITFPDKKLEKADTNLCNLGARMFCFQDVVINIFGKEVCDKEFQELQDPSPAPSPQSEAKSLDK